MPVPFSFFCFRHLFIRARSYSRRTCSCIADTQSWVMTGSPSISSKPKDECINNAIYLYVPYLDEIEKILAAVADELMYSKPTFKRVNRGAETMREYPQSKWHELFDTAKYDHLRMATGTDTACTSKHI
ncbi:hypothetical protein PR003_g19158 [Phytophthora rubi]|uniref:Uncharacterized protein n=1 Tax=Phytophthora rubi TaxID=129364 RepID=A0A6A4DYN5_9STRA|nr:hypothetical protein PR003_g19158 [Phytophthora rubi]